MSDPTRYRVANNQAQLTLGGGILAVDPAGPLVMYDDYARLKAEVERLTAEVSYDNRVQLHVDKLAAEFTQYEVERLQAEVERLRKVGDEMATLFGGDYSDHDGVCYDTKWNAAKEGKPTE